MQSVKSIADALVIMRNLGGLDNGKSA